MNEDIEHQFDLLSKYKANLRRTEIQAAQYGADVPVKLQNDVSYYRERIAEIDIVISQHSMAEQWRKQYVTECLVRIHDELVHNSKVFLKTKPLPRIPAQIPPSEKSSYVNNILTIVMSPEFPVFVNSEWVQVYQNVAEGLDVDNFEWTVATNRFIREIENAHGALLETTRDQSHVLDNYRWYISSLESMEIYFDITIDTLSDTLTGRGVNVKRY